MKARLLFWLKICLSVGLLAYLFTLILLFGRLSGVFALVSIGIFAYLACLISPMSPGSWSPMWLVAGQEDRQDPRVFQELPQEPDLPSEV